ncbi:MAG: cadmium resistance transporter [Rhizonema sp. PD37]|nr:cadmium resistance transporter [Rhizonema sp. PD37]
MHLNITINELGTAFVTAVTAFAATNIDDTIILLLFFSQVNESFRWWHIVIGQYLGFTAIIIFSLPGFFGGLVIRREWIGLLGLLPIAIGLKQLIHREQETTELQTVANIFQPSSQVHPIKSFLFSVFNPQTYKVAGVTFANGGDNISIYVPLFAGNNFISLGIILSIFFVMVGIWCVIAYLLARQPSISHALSRYGKAAVPFVLIALGLFIMYERGTFGLLLNVLT